MIATIDPNPRAGIRYAVAALIFALIVLGFTGMLGFALHWPFSLVMVGLIGVMVFSLWYAAKFYLDPSLGSARIVLNPDGLVISHKRLFGHRDFDPHWGEIDWFGKAKGRSDWALVIRLTHNGAVRSKRLAPSMRENAFDMFGRRKLMISDNAFAMPIDDILKTVQQAAENAGFDVKVSRSGKRFTLGSERLDN